MTSVITGDIIGSRQQKSEHWVEDLKKILAPFGKTPNQWEVYRGDEFQIEINNPEDALLAAILVKAHLRAIKSDARMSIGFGDKTHNAERISESNGSAFINSGELFETLKKQKVTLALRTGDIDFDEKLNLMHIAICRLLEPYGFYEFEYFDEEGWPHYKVKEELPPLKAGEQSVLMKEAIVNYFLERELIQ